MDRSGQWGELKPARINLQELGRYPDSQDRALLGWFFSEHRTQSNRSYYYGSYVAPFAQVALQSAVQEMILTRLAETGRLFLQERLENKASLDPADASDPMPLVPDPLPWALELHVERGEKTYLVHGNLTRRADSNQRTGEPPTPSLSLPISGLVGYLPSELPDGQALLVFKDRLARFERNPHSRGWMQALLGNRSIEVPLQEGDTLVETVLQSPGHAQVHWPKELQWKSASASPAAIAIFQTPVLESRNQPSIPMNVEWEYEGTRIVPESPLSRLPDSAHRRILLRSTEKEHERLDELRSVPGLQAPSKPGESGFLTTAQEFSSVVEKLLSLGWEVEAEGQKLRVASSFKAFISSGVDWFDLRASADFGEGVTVPLPQLLAALARGERFVRLGSGTYGMLPVGDHVEARFSGPA